MTGRIWKLAAVGVLLWSALGCTEVRLRGQLLTEDNADWISADRFFVDAEHRVAFEIENFGAFAGKPRTKALILRDADNQYTLLAKRYANIERECQNLRGERLELDIRKHHQIPDEADADLLLAQFTHPGGHHTLHWVLVVNHDDGGQAAIGLALTPPAKTEVQEYLRIPDKHYQISGDTIVFDETATARYRKELMEFMVKSAKREDAGVKVVSVKDGRQVQAIFAKARRAAEESQQRNSADNPTYADLFQLLRDAPESDGNALRQALNSVRIVVRISQPSDDLSDSSVRKGAQRALEKLGIRSDSGASAVLLLEVSASGLATTETRGGVSTTVKGYALVCQARLLLPTFVFRPDRIWYGNTSPLSATIEESLYGGIHADWAEDLGRRATQAALESASQVAKGSRSLEFSSSEFETRLSRCQRGGLGLLSKIDSFNIEFDRTIVPPTAVLFRYDQIYGESAARNDFVSHLRAGGVAIQDGDHSPDLSFRLRYDPVEFETIIGTAHPLLCGVFESVSIQVSDVCVYLGDRKYHWVGSTNILKKTNATVIAARLPTVFEEKARIRGRANKVLSAIEGLREQQSE